MGAQARRQHPGEDRRRAGALARAGALHVGECVRLGLVAVGGWHVPVSRRAEQGAPLHSSAARRRPHRRLPGSISLHQLVTDNPMSTKRFRIALSFAGEKRDYVSKVAAILAKQFGEDKILYDKFHEAEFAGYDLGIRLPKLYGEESDLIVPVLCPVYDAKRWTGWEWVH